MTNTRQILTVLLWTAMQGMISHVIGEALPRHWFSASQPLFRCHDWEKNGRVYRRVGVQKWKDKLPDMSHMLKSMYTKELNGNVEENNIQRFIQETCVAELVHLVLFFTSFLALLFAHGHAAVLLTLLVAFSNIPFIVIQRYNRPRLARMLRAAEMTVRMQEGGCRA